MSDYSNWKILKSELGEKREEYAEVSEWCNNNGQYCIIDDGEYYKVVPIEPYVPTKDDMSEKRRQAFIEEADPLRYNYDEDCARYGYESEQALASKEIWLAKKDEIRNRYSYPEEKEN